MKSKFIAGVSLFTLGVALIASPAFADPLSITGSQSTAVRTSAASGGTAGDISIASGGSLTPPTGTALTVDSNNNASNAGSITINDADGAVGIQAIDGVSGSIANSGAITVSESYARSDTNGDSVLDGPYAQGSNRFGIQTLGDFNGAISNSGTITVQGNNSAGIALGGSLAGSFNQTGTISLSGDNGYGLRTQSVTGDVMIGGVITAYGTNSSAVLLGGDVGGALLVNGSLTSTGYSSIALPSSTTSLTAQNLEQGGPTMWIAGSVAGGAQFAASTTTTNSDGTTTTTTAATLSSYAAAPALLIGSSSSAITLGSIATDANGYGLELNGTIAGMGDYSGFDAHGVQIGGLGQNVSIANGLTNGGTIKATTVGGSAVALEIGAGATMPTIANSGTITASGSSSAPLTTAIQIDAGASISSLTNSGTITGNAGTQSYAIRDQSGQLTSITNSGTIQAIGGTTNIAIDLSATQGDVSIVQNATSSSTVAAAITGAVLFGGTGNDTLQLNAGAMTGDVTFGAGTNLMQLTGGATYQGNVDFASALGTLTVENEASFSGAITHAGNVAVTLSNGSLTTSGNVPLASLTVNAGTLGVTVDGTTGAATNFQVAGTASFGSGSSVALQFNNLNHVIGTYRILDAGSISGGSNLTLNSAALPYLFSGNLQLENATPAIDVIVTRKSAAQLGLSPLLSTIYEPAYAAGLTDTTVGNYLLSLSDANSLNATLRAMLPDFAGDTFDSVSLSTRMAQRPLANPELPIEKAGEYGLWLQQFGWFDSKGAGSSLGYHNSGWGLEGGFERAFGSLGRIGIAVTYAYGSDSVVDTPTTVSSDEVELAAYWRASWHGFHAYAVGGIGSAKFHSSRALLNLASTGGAALIRNTGEWTGHIVTAGAGLSYQLDLGRFLLRPQASIDYVHLNEEGYTETGGGSGLDLIVDPRTGSETGFYGNLAIGYKLIEPVDQQGSYLKLELAGGDRRLLSTQLGSTTAQFAGGDSFTLTPDERSAGWTADIRAVGGDSSFSVTAQVGAAHEQDRTTLTFMASVIAAL
jgi:hypothetical protein